MMKIYLQVLTVCLASVLIAVAVWVAVPTRQITPAPSTPRTDTPSPSLTPTHALTPTPERPKSYGSVDYRSEIERYIINPCMEYYLDKNGIQDWELRIETARLMKAVAGPKIDALVVEVTASARGISSLTRRKLIYEVALDKCKQQDHTPWPARSRGGSGAPTPAPTRPRTPTPTRPRSVDLRSEYMRYVTDPCIEYLLDQNGIWDPKERREKTRLLKARTSLFDATTEAALRDVPSFTARMRIYEAGLAECKRATHR